MNSETAKALDSSYNRMQWAGEEYLLEEVVEAAGEKLREKGEVYPKDVIYWIGYIYRYWHYYTGEARYNIYPYCMCTTWIQWSQYVQRCFPEKALMQVLTPLLSGIITFAKASTKQELKKHDRSHCFS